MQTVRLVQVLGHWYECSWDGVGPLKRGFLQAPDLGFFVHFSTKTEQKCLNLYICTLVKTMKYIRKLSGVFALGYNFSRLHVLFNFADLRLLGTGDSGQ